MAVRNVVLDFFRLGRLPDGNASQEVIALHRDRLEHIKAPVTDEEAELLARLFRPYACFELAQMLLHLIESAPGGCPVKVQLPPEVPLTQEEKVMASHKAIEQLVQLGPLPAESDASEDDVALRSYYLERIIAPVTNEEAALLVKCFGPDDCFGNAWTLLHLIESAPGGCPVKAQPNTSDNEWLRLLWDRSHREGHEVKGATEAELEE